MTCDLYGVHNKEYSIYLTSNPNSFVHQMSEHSETPVHPHAGLPSALWPAGVPQTDRQSSVHGQAGRLPGGDVAVG